MPNWFNRVLSLPKIKHSTFDLSNNLKTSFNIGQLVPVNLEECLPSDKFLHISQEVSIRFAPLLFPIMHGIKVHTSNFFVPFRIILGDDLYKDFLNNQRNFVPIVITFDTTSSVNPFINTVIDYLSYDINIASYVQSGTTYHWSIVLTNPLPLLSYFTIVRDWYLDSNIESSQIDYYDNLINSYREQVIVGSQYTLVLQLKDTINTFKVSYSKDYFNTARPQPELGSQMYVLNRPLNLSGNDTQLGFYTQDGSSIAINGHKMYADSTQTELAVSPQNLNNMHLSESTTIRDLWRKEMLQQYYQVDNKFGSSRIREKLAGHFGVLYSDNRIQIPRYLGGSSTYVKISEVIQTSSSTDDSPQGTFTGKAGAYHQTKNVTYYCEEHGYFLTLVSLIPDNGYCNGQPRTFFKTNIFDFASPEFNNIGWQEIYNGEIFADGSSADKQAFGYQPRYSEYRSHPSRAVADFRRSTFLGWHLDRNFSSLPPLNSNFLKVADTTRIFSSDNPYGVENPCYLDVYNHVTMSRPISYEPDSMHIY